MQFRGDSLLAKIEAKSQVNRWRAIAVIAIVAALVLFIEGGANLGGKPGAAGLKVKGDYIARVTILDFIYDNYDLQELLEEVAEDDDAKALIVWIDTPGGSAVGGEEIYHRLREVSAHKPVVAVMRSMATSAGYMIAIGTDYIVAREGTITGSIGVILETAEVTELAEKLGINPITVKSSPLKGSPGLFEKPSEEAINSLKVLIDSFYHTFVKMVADRRPFTLERAYELSDGRVYSGAQALDYQLIDAIGGEKEALNWLKEKKEIDIELEIVDVDAKPKGLEIFEDLTETVSQKFFNFGASSLDGLRLIWHPTLQ